MGPAVTTLPDARTPHAAVDEFVSHLRFERGLSENSVAAYGRDLAKWMSYCAARGLDVTAAKPGHLTDFLARLRKGLAPAAVPLAPSSVARALVSVRSFYRFLAREGRVTIDPTATVDSPARPRSLPKAISLEEVERLLQSPP
ncbi:MAG: site-specific integrase, partial [Actinomycetota bacterium]|nr:site-specific integrase [Actinomycetota bacterium]